MARFLFPYNVYSVLTHLSYRIDNFFRKTKFDNKEPQNHHTSRQSKLTSPSALGGRLRAGGVALRPRAGASGDGGRGHRAGDARQGRRRARSPGGALRWSLAGTVRTDVVGLDMSWE